MNAMKTTPSPVVALSLALLGVAGGLVLLAELRARAQATQPVIGAHVKRVLTVEGLRFKDSNGNGLLDPYEAGSFSE